MSREPNPSPPRVREWHDVDLERFETEISPRGEPAVLRGLAAHWQAVAAARESNDGIRTYLSRLDRGAQVRTFVGDAAMRGRFFYKPQFDGFNFGVAEAPF